MSPEMKILCGFLGVMMVVDMNWKWIFLLLWKLVGFFTGSKGTRIKFEARSEEALADEHKHLEELKAEVRRLKHELDAIAEQAPAVLDSGNYSAVVALNKRRNELRDEWDAAGQRVLDFERYCREGR